MAMAIVGRVPMALAKNPDSTMAREKAMKNAEKIHCTSTMSSFTCSWRR